jgi:type IV fimbrial biogenesis protein FimT
MEKYRQKILGFTLVELMVTVAVIAVILVIGVPGIANMKRSGDLVTTSKDLVGALNFARAEAVRQGLTIDVNPITSGSWADGWRVELGGTAIREFEAPPPGSSVTLTTGAAPVSFAGLGNVITTSCFDVSVTGSSSVRSVDISPAGRVTTCRATCTVIAGDPTKCD